MAYNNNCTNVSFAPGTYNPGNAYAQSTNPRGSMYLTDPTGPFPVVTNGPKYRSVPSGYAPDPNLDYNTVFGQGSEQGYGQPYGQPYGQGSEQPYGQGSEQPYGQGYGQGYGGKLRKHRKTKKGGRRHKSRKHHKKSSRRYHR